MSEMTTIVADGDGDDADDDSLNGDGADMMMTTIVANMVMVMMTTIVANGDGDNDDDSCK